MYVCMCVCMRFGTPKTQLRAAGMYVCMYVCIAIKHGICMAVTIDEGPNTEFASV